MLPDVAADTFEAIPVVGRQVATRIYDQPQDAAGGLAITPTARLRRARKTATSRVSATSAKCSETTTECRPLVPVPEPKAAHLRQSGGDVRVYSEQSCIDARVFDHRECFPAFGDQKKIAGNLYKFRRSQYSRSEVEKQ